MGSPIDIDKGILGELHNMPVWVAVDGKAPCNSSGNRFSNWSEPDTKLFTYAEALAIKDKFGLTGVGMIFPANGIDKDGYRLIAIDVDEVDGYRKARPATKGGKPAVTAITFDPATDAAEVLAKVPLVAQLPPTVWEASGSCTGFHGFLWLPQAAVDGLWAKNKAQLAGCDHADIFMAGRAGRHLAITGVLLTGCIAIARLDDVTPLLDLLKPANATTPAQELQIPDGGKAIDLGKLELSEDQRHLIEGTGTIDRSKILHGLLKDLIDTKGAQPADLLATLVDNDPLAAYLLQHRNQNPDKAIEFARREIGKAYAESKTGMTAALFVHNLKWADGEPVAVGEADDTDKLRVFIPGGEFLKGGEPQFWLIDGILEKKTHNACMGHPGNGKTLGVLEMVMHIAFGLSFNGLQTAQGRIVYIAGEDADGLRRRMKIWCLDRNIDESELNERISIIDRPILDSEEGIADMVHDAKIFRPDVIVIDTFVTNYGGESEDKAIDMKNWMKMIRQDLIATFGCCVLTLHHPPKGSTNIFNFRGSGVAKGDLDNMLGFQKNGKDHVSMISGADNPECKRRSTADFGTITWEVEKTTVPGTCDNNGNPETTVRATLSNGPVVPDEVLICKAIEVFTKRHGKFTQGDICDFTGFNKSKVSNKLRQMVKDGLVAKAEPYRLTEAGTVRAGFADLHPDVPRKVRAILGTTAV